MWWFSTKKKLVSEVNRIGLPPPPNENLTNSIVIPVEIVVGAKNNTISGNSISNEY